MPDHPSWPAELVEKGARQLWDHDEQAAANSRSRDRPYTVLSWEHADEMSREDYREQVGAVLSALSGDLVPREEVEDHDIWLSCVDGGYGGYAAACSTCDWRGETHPPGREGKAAARADLRAHVAASASVDDEVEIPWSIPTSDSPAIELVPRSQADALAEALEEAQAQLIEFDAPIPASVKRALAYRSKPAPGETK